MKKIILSLSLLAGGLALTSCSEKSEQVAADETADQMEDVKTSDVNNAAMEGRNAAKAIVTKNFTDTAELQQAVLEARAQNSKYEMAGDKRGQQAFDSAFFATIKTVRPELAKALDAKSK